MTLMIWPLLTTPGAGPQPGLRHNTPCWSLPSGPLRWLIASQKLFSMSLKQSPTRLISLTLSSWLQSQHLLPAVKQSNVLCSQGSVTSIHPRFSLLLSPLFLVTISRKPGSPGGLALAAPHELLAIASPSLGLFCSFIKLNSRKQC